MYMKNQLMDTTVTRFLWQVFPYRTSLIYNHANYVFFMVYSTIEILDAGQDCSQ